MILYLKISNYMCLLLSGTSWPYNSCQPSIKMLSSTLIKPVARETGGDEHVNVLGVPWVIMVEIVAALDRCEYMISVNVVRFDEQVPCDES